MQQTYNYHLWLVFLIFASITPFIINKIGGLKPIIMGGIVSIFGAIGLLAFHATELSVSVNLAILASGLSLTMTAAWNMVVSKEYMMVTVSYPLIALG